jgi:hypothetical protein
MPHRPLSVFPPQRGLNLARLYCHQQFAAPVCWGSVCMPLQTPSSPDRVRVRVRVKVRVKVRSIQGGANINLFSKGVRRYINC